MRACVRACVRVCVCEEVVFFCLFFFLFTSWTSSTRWHLSVFYITTPSSLLHQATPLVFSSHTHTHTHAHARTHTHTHVRARAISPPPPTPIYIHGHPPPPHTHTHKLPHTSHIHAQHCLTATGSAPDQHLHTSMNTNTIRQHGWLTCPEIPILTSVGRVLSGGPLAGNLPVVGHRGRRNEGPLCWEPRPVRSSLPLNPGMVQNMT